MGKGSCAVVWRSALGAPKLVLVVVLGGSLLILALLILLALELIGVRLLTIALLGILLLVVVTLLLRFVASWNEIICFIKNLVQESSVQRGRCWANQSVGCACKLCIAQQQPISICTLSLAGMEVWEWSLCLKYRPG